MEITPQDLGEKWRRDLLKRRTVRRIGRALRNPQGGSDPDSGQSKRRTRHRRLVRWWLGNSRLPKSDLEALTASVTSDTVGFSVQSLVLQSLGVAVLIFLGCLGVTVLDQVIFNDYHWARVSAMMTAAFVLPGAWMAWHAGMTALVSPRLAMRHVNTDAVTAGEIEAFLPTARGDLDRAYLNTVLESLRQPLPSVASQDIRAALRAVGDTVSVLPGSLLEAGMDDPATLRANATEKRQRADAEADSLVQASLRRQADADERQAQILEQSGTAAKRARARHEETAGQINTIRAVLSVYASPENAAQLEQGNVLQETVRRVSGEAVAASAAKRELEDGEIVALYGAALPEPQIQTVGAGGAQRSGKWWQGTGGNG